MTISTGNALPLAALSADIPLDAQLSQSLNLMADDAALFDESLFSADFSALLEQQMAPTDEGTVLVPEDADVALEESAQTQLESVFELSDASPKASDEAVFAPSLQTDLANQDDESKGDAGVIDASLLAATAPPPQAEADMQSARLNLDLKTRQAQQDAQQVEPDEIAAVMPNVAAVVQTDGETLPPAQSASAAVTPLVGDVAASVRAPAELVQQALRTELKAGTKVHPAISTDQHSNDDLLLESADLVSLADKESAESARKETTRFDALLAKNEPASALNSQNFIPTDRSGLNGASEFGAAAMTQLHNTNTAQSQFNTPLQSLQLAPQATPSQWGDALGEKVSLLISHKLQSAEIRIDPPHLGKLDIQIQLKDDSATINIQTHHAPTRDLIDAASFRLREFLQDSGYSSVDVNVSHREQSMAQDSAQGDAHHSENGGDRETSGETLAALSGLQTPAAMQMFQVNGVIDYFA
jgi:flagellar hook-length control protein FliK